MSLQMKIKKEEEKHKQRIKDIPHCSNDALRLSF